MFQTSTGEAGFETRNQNGSRVFRFNPATANGGWHNSTDYPVAADNPLNGNMYKPLYFDDGQAIHGANNVPTSPQSKGCARLRVGDHQTLVDWLGLGGVVQPDLGPRVTSTSRSASRGITEFRSGHVSRPSLLRSDACQPDENSLDYDSSPTRSSHVIGAERSTSTPVSSTIRPSSSSGVRTARSPRRTNDGPCHRTQPSRS